MGQDAGGVAVDTADQQGESMGLKAGDLIVALEGKPVKNIAALITICKSLKADGPATLTISRQQARQDLKLTGKIALPTN